MPAFPQWQIRQQEGKLQLGNQVVYTARSIDREVRSLRQRLTSCQADGTTLLWVAPFDARIADAINAPVPFAWLSPGSNDQRAICDDDAWQYFLREIDPRQRFTVAMHPVLARLPEGEAVGQLIEVGLREAAARLKTIGHFERIWQRNFQHNHRTWLQSKAVTALELETPSALVLGGPGVDSFLAKAELRLRLWCADTALTPLLHAGLLPDLVFSIDAGFGSYEHMLAPIVQAHLGKLHVVLDALSFPRYYLEPFASVFTYASSHPLIQASENDFVELENNTGDVFGLMISVFSLLYPDQPIPEIIGRDGKTPSRVSHARGSGYFRRQHTKMTRLASPENYFLQLSRRFD